MASCRGSVLAFILPWVGSAHLIEFWLAVFGACFLCTLFCTAGGWIVDNGSGRRVMSEREYLTTREVADLARLSTRRLAELRLNGTGPRFVRTTANRTGKALYRAADVHRWLRRNAEQFDRQLKASRSGG